MGKAYFIISIAFLIHLGLCILWIFGQFSDWFFWPLTVHGVFTGYFVAKYIRTARIILEIKEGIEQKEREIIQGIEDLNRAIQKIKEDEQKRGSN